MVNKPLQRSSADSKSFLTLNVNESESRSVVSDSLRPHGLCSPLNSPGQDTGVGNVSLLQGIFPTPGIEPGSPTLQADLSPNEPPEKPRQLHTYTDNALGVA